MHRRLSVPTVAILLAPVPQHLPAQARPGIALIDTAVLVAPALAESSGIAASRRHPGVLWTHNDSGGGPFLHATDSTGRDLGAVRVRSAHNRDWEDIAVAPCFIVPGSCVYVADIGDNGRRRPYVVIYRLREPEVPGRGRTARAQLLDSTTLRYRDAAHDAEGIAVTADGRLLLATKDRRGPAQLLSAMLTARSGTETLEPWCTLAVQTEFLLGRVVTGLDLSPDGALLAARTYRSIHLFRNDQACTPLTAPSGMAIPVVEAQGEGIGFTGPHMLILSSERGGDHGHAILMRLRLLGLP